MALKQITVFCGASSGKDPCFLKAAAELGSLFLKKNIGLVYGSGANGIMGQIARVIHEGGGKVTGVLPQFMLDNDVCGIGYGETIVMDSMHQRKQYMCDNADAFIALPGGFGTMEELVEMITWVQLELHNKPVGILNTNNFYKGLLDWIDKATEEDMIHGAERCLYVVGSTPEELLDKIIDQKKKRHADGN